MAGVEGKGRATLVDGNPNNNEARVINGRLLVRVVPRGTRREGYGSAQLKGGVASKGEAVITAGALRING